jgi:hypothetical protein
MLKLLCAGAIAAYAYLPTLVAHAVFAVDDPWGCRSCLHPCGATISPIWNHVMFGGAILGMTCWGVYDIRRKNGIVAEDSRSEQG